MEYNIEYDPFTLDLLDDNISYSLAEFDVEDFDECITNLAGARAENGATQQRITGEISELHSNMVSIEGHRERSSYHPPPPPATATAKTMNNVKIRGREGERERGREGERVGEREREREGERDRNTYI